MEMITLVRFTATLFMLQEIIETLTREIQSQEMKLQWAKAMRQQACSWKDTQVCHHLKREM